MRRQFWLVKQEPTEYCWATFVKDGRAAWTGVRNFQARNHLRAMRRGDLVAFYHSGDDKRVVGLARVTGEHYPDPTATAGDWSSVDLAPLKALSQSVPLSAVKADPVLRDIHSIRQPRLSVCPLTEEQFQRLLALGRTRP